MSIKISFIHHRNCITWTRVKLLVVFEEFDMVYAFWLIFSFHCHCQFVKGQLKQSDCSPPNLVLLCLNKKTPMQSQFTKKVIKKITDQSQCFLFAEKKYLGLLLKTISVTPALTNIYL